jgi:tellurite resistance protein TerC
LSIHLWLGFVALIVGLLAVDLGVFHRLGHVIGARESLGWSAFWIGLGLAFSVVVYYAYDAHWLGVGRGAVPLDGGQAAVQYITGYVIEKSLSLDNIFVIAMIFSYFSVPAAYQHRVLYWGILGAIVLRGAMILAGAALIQRFSWTTYVFGAFLLVSAVKLLITRHDSIDPDRNPLVRLARRLFPVSAGFEGERFLTHINGRRAVTPLLLVLLVIESSDVVFAVDSIPAIFAVTRDPFIVFTSNIFAILGLRALYFALAAVMGLFRYMKMSLVFVLAYVGVKMILSHHYPIPAGISLAFIAGILLVGVVASLYASRDTARLASPLDARD